MVYIVEKPPDWQVRFTALEPYTTFDVRSGNILGARQMGPDMLVEMQPIQEQAVVIPADAFPTQEARPIGHVVLEVSNFINPRAGAAESIASMILMKCPNLQVCEYLNERSYARFQVAL